MPAKNQTNNKLRGCLVGGCITTSIILILGGGCVGWSIYSAYNYVKPYTSTTPPSLPDYIATEQETKQLLQRIQAFHKAPSIEQQSTELRLSADDLNVLASLDKGNLSQHLRFNIVDDQLVMQGGIPLDRFPGFSGRYLNGTYNLSISLKNNKLTVTPTDFSIEENKIPHEFKSQLIEMLREENLAPELMRKREVQQLVENITTISIQKGYLVLTK